MLRLRSNAWAAEAILITPDRRVPRKAVLTTVRPYSKGYVSPQKGRIQVICPLPRNSSSSLAGGDVSCGIHRKVPRKRGALQTLTQPASGAFVAEARFEG
jgi:hypothetical protein